MFAEIREAEKATELWFGDRSGGFEKIREGVKPNTVDLPELKVHKHKLRFKIYCCYEIFLSLDPHFFRWSFYKKRLSKFDRNNVSDTNKNL